MNPQTTASSGANGHSTMHDIFVLADEQILEIEPEPRDVAAPGAEPAPQQNAQATAPDETATAVLTPGPFATPEDVRALADLYPSGLNQAKVAAERARTLDEIDAAYFGAPDSSPEQVSASRAHLAQRMLRENPAAFREMVFAGLRALEQANVAPAGPAPVAPPLLAVPALSQAHAGVPAPPVAPPLPALPNAATGAGAQQPLRQLGNTSASEGHLAAYRAFEQAANADLEKSVGGAIDRALHQALPNLQSPPGANVGARFGASPSSAAEQQSASLPARLSQAIREDVEKALQGDRQLGEQVAQILSARRLDDGTRAQVVRLINDRAQQLVPSAARRALNDWTQATLAAHRSRTTRNETTASRREVAPASLPANPHGFSQRPVAHPFSGEAPARLVPQTPRSDAHAAGNNRLNYRKLSDEQILDL